MAHSFAVMNSSSRLSLLSEMKPRSWSDLPRELLDLIWKRLDDNLDCIRFRSICTSWRERYPAVNPANNLLPFGVCSFPQGPPMVEANHHPYGEYLPLSKHTFYLIKPPLGNEKASPWIIRVNEDSNQSTRLVNPEGFSDAIHHEILDCHFWFKFLDLSVSKLAGGIFMTQEPDLYFPEKVAVANFPNKTLCLANYNLRPFLYLFRHRGADFPTPCPIVNGFMALMDICMYNGSVYVVDKAGATIKVSENEPTMDHIITNGCFSASFDRARDKHLINQGECLLLVDMASFPVIRGIKVYELDARNKQWLLKDTTDFVIFLGREMSFALKVSDLKVSRGNCIVLMDGAFKKYHRTVGVMPSRGMSMVLLDQGCVVDITPEFERLFWPAPEWANSPHFLQQRP